MSKSCATCSKVFQKKSFDSVTRWGKKRYCSIVCAPSSFKKGAVNPFTGHKHTEESKLKMSQQLTGRRVSLETRRKISEANRGNKSHLWKGGITAQNHTERKVIMNTFEYKEWRKTVFERDDFTCQKCGVRGGNLQTDHIKPFALFPESRLDLDNGRTLCVPCHKATDTYGYRVFKTGDKVLAHY